MRPCADDDTAIAAVDGVDGVFVGPSDLAASMGLLGQQTHPEALAQRWVTAQGPVERDSY